MADDDALDVPAHGRSDAALEPEEEAAFEDEGAGLSVADIDTAVTQLREQPFAASHYPGSIGDVSVAKLRSSIVAPLVAQARGYRTITGGEDAKDAQRRHGLDGRSRPGRHLVSLAKQGAWMEIPYFKLDSIARGEPILGTLQLRPEDDPPEGSSWAKYMFLAGSGTAIDAHPATPASWFADGAIPVLLTEGVVKADSALTAMLRHADIDDAELSTAVGATDPRDRLRELLEQVPPDKRILVLAIPGVQSWRRNDEWNTLGLRGREAIVCFDGDIARNAAVWDAAYGLMEFLSKRNTCQVNLIDLSARGDETVDPKRGIDDFLAYSGTWPDALGLRVGELPGRPVDDTGEKGQTRVTQDGLSVEVCKVRADPAGGPDITTWQKVDDIGGRLISFEEFRMPTADELEGGRIIPGAVSRAERQAVVQVQWRDSEGLVDSAIIRGPKSMLDEDPAKWETRYGADVPTKVSALSSWPPRSGISWTRAIKDYRASETTDDVLWGCQGWVPTRDGVPAFIAGRKVIGPDGAGDERAQAGLTADDFPNIDDFGVIDAEMSVEEQRDLLRRVVDAYTSSDTFVDPRFGMVALLAGVRPDRADHPALGVVHRRWASVRQVVAGLDDPGVLGLARRGVERRAPPGLGDGHPGLDGERDLEVDDVGDRRLRPRLRPAPVGEADQRPRVDGPQRVQRHRQGTHDAGHEDPCAESAALVRGGHRRERAADRLGARPNADPVLRRWGRVHQPRLRRPAGDS